MQKEITTTQAYQYFDHKLSFVNFNSCFMRVRFAAASSLMLVLSSLAYYSFGQNFNASGGRALGMASTSILLVDEYGLFNNPGAVDVTSLTFLASYHTQYITLGINDVRLGMVLPVKKFTTGIGILFYGDELFNQMRISSFLAHNFGFAKVALRTNYSQYYVQNYGYRNNITIDIGGVFTLSQQLQLAMVFQNLTRSKLSGETNTPLNSLIQLGLSYHPIDKFRADIQLDKSIEQPPSLRFGVEYKATDLIALRTGFNPASGLAALGLGLTWQTFTLDLAGNYTHQLGYAGILSFMISPKKK